MFPSAQTASCILILCWPSSHWHGRHFNDSPNCHVTEGNNHTMQSSYACSSADLSSQYLASMAIALCTWVPSFQGDLRSPVCKLRLHLSGP